MVKLTAFVQGLFAPSITAEHPVSASSVAAASVCGTKQNMFARA